MHGKLPMKLSQLLQARENLIRRAGLANLAFAYELLSNFARRIARARLSGSVTLKSADPDADLAWASLTALEGNQSVIEEHFTDEDIMDFSDAIVYVTGGDEVNLTFRLEDLSENFLVPLRGVLEQAGVEVDAELPASNADTSENRRD
jgi:hypothetical protein